MESLAAIMTSASNRSVGPRLETSSGSRNRRTKCGTAWARVYLDTDATINGQYRHTMRCNGIHTCSGHESTNNFSGGFGLTLLWFFQRTDALFACFLGQALDPIAGRFHFRFRACLWTRTINGLNENLHCLESLRFSFAVCRLEDLQRVRCENCKNLNHLLLV